MNRICLFLSYGAVNDTLETRYRHNKQENIHVLSGIRTLKTSNQAAVDIRSRPQKDRQLKLHTFKTQTVARVAICASFTQSCFAGNLQDCLFLSL
jgi:hypothetical protein